jgi:hypothetical protein
MQSKEASLILLITVGLSCSATAATGGSITGIVLDSQGSPVSGAKVLALELESSPHRLLKFHLTDVSGRFYIQDLPWGTYSMWAGKEEAGYPELPSLFYAPSSLPTVILRRKSPSSSVTIRLGPKAGAIEAVEIVDSKTGREVIGVITLQRGTDQKTTMEASTTQKPILIPSESQVRVAVAASGYKPWPASGAPNGAGILRLRPGEGVELAVELAPQGSEAVSVGSFSPAPYSPGPSVAVPAPTEGNPILLKEVKEFRVTASGISAPVEQLARRFKVPIGLELSQTPSDGASARPINVNVENGTVQNVLDAVVAADPEYAWRESDYGTIGVSPRNHTPWLPDVVVGKYSIRNSNRDDAIGELMKAPEVQQWLRSSSVEFRDFQGLVTSEGGRVPSTGASLFSISLSHESFRTVLNAILIASESPYWAISRYGAHQEFISVIMGD